MNKQKQIEDAWLGINVDESKLFNPMEFINQDSDGELLLKRLSWLMMRPEYFSFACKYILNIEISPFQALLLYEMWNRKFPMLVGSRGMGKALKPNENIRIENGWRQIKDIEIGDKVYSSSGSLCNVTNKTFLQKNLNMYRITLRDGRQIECCEDHMWKVWDKNKNRNSAGPVWSEIKTKDMLDNYFWNRVGKKSTGVEYRYAIPINAPIDDTQKEYTIHPYILGVVLGDGCVSHGRVVITTKDEEIINRVERFLPKGYRVSKLKSPYSYSIVMDGASRSFFNLFADLGLGGCKSDNKFIPDIYKYGSLDQRLELVKGLMDTDGYSNGQSVIQYYTISDRLSGDFLDITRSLGFHCKHTTKESWFKGVRFKDCHKISIYTEQEVFSLPRKLEYLNHTVSKQGRSKYEKVFITNIEYIGKSDGYCITVDSDDRTYITKDYIVTHNSFILSVYPLLRALFMPRRKVIIVGAAFRQSKVLFEYMDTIWKNAPVLRDLCPNNSGPRRDVDRCVMYIGQSTITALPLGDGSKIRGQRANDIIADEFACLESGSLVETESGLIRIEDFDSARKTKIYTGDDKLSLEVAESYIKTPPQNVYEIKLANGYIIRCSENHLVMSKEGWKKSLELTENDWIEQAPVLDNWGDFHIDKDLAWLAGMLISEGSITEESRISIKTTDIETVNKIVEKFGWKVNTRPSYKDDRFDCVCKESYEVYTYDKSLRNELYNIGLEYTKAHGKKIPNKILQAPKNVIISFLSGLFDGDGSCFLWKDKKVKNKIGLSYYSVSERLCRDIQVLMAKLGFDGYITSRSSKLSEKKQWMVRWNGFSAYEAAKMLDVPRFAHAIENCSYPEVSSNICWDKSRNKWKVRIVHEGKKVQKRFSSYNEASAFLCDLNKTKYRKVISVTKLAHKDTLYDYYLPATNSFYAEGHRQHNSIPRDIFENVVAGFAAVASSPIEKVKQKAKEKKAKELGIPIEKKEEKNTNDQSNQIILSGTAYYDFNHFAEYFKRYHAIVSSGGDERKLAEVFGGSVPPDFDYTNYSVMRFPVEKLPDGFMDAGQIGRAKATVHSGIFQMEYGAVFTTDSQGFFKRSLIENCTVSPNNPAKTPSGEVCFEASLKGDSNKKYVFGVDPASEIDNFSIVVMEVNSDHRKVVHCWTTNRKSHKELLKSKIVDEDDFYSYCAKKIRQLMKVFPCYEIALDAQGGGIAVMEALHDKDKIPEGELPIWPVIEDKPKDTDDNAGLHILRMCQFAKYDWLAEANHGLRKDLEDRIVLFPYFDSVSIGLALEVDKSTGKKYDTLEDCVMEIEELKDELSMIVMTQTSLGRERWDTPEVKTSAGRKSRLRKDRYSSLIMANMSARNLLVEKTTIESGAIGGFANGQPSFIGRDEKLFSGPAWFMEKTKGLY